MNSLELLAMVISAGLSGVTTLLATAIWFKLGRLEGENGGVKDRLSSIERRIGHLEGAR